VRLISLSVRWDVDLDRILDHLRVEVHEDLTGAGWISEEDAKLVRSQIALEQQARQSESGYQRLHVHAAMTRRSPGRVLDELIDAHLKDFRVQDLRPGRIDRSDGAGDVAPPLRGL
jgi:hypothetical protein